jgi:hypothetical protein
MAMDEVSRLVLHTANGTQKSFPFAFTIFKNDQVAVYRRPEDGEEERVNIGEYDVTLSDTGGTVTFSTAPAEGTIIALLSAVPYTQEMELTNYGGFNPVTLNDNADWQCAQIQQLQEAMTRTLKLGPTSTELTADKLMELIKAAIEAYNKLINAMVYKRAEWTLPTDMPAGTHITIPNQITYTVGLNQLLVFWNGMMLTRGGDGNYSEVGAAGALSGEIITNFDMKEGDDIVIWYSPVGEGRDA